MNKKLIWMIFLAFLVGLVVGIVLWKMDAGVAYYIYGCLWHIWHLKSI